MRITVIFLLLGLILTGCASRDTKLGQQISGTWTRAGGDLPVKSDGSLLILSWDQELTDPGSVTFSSDGSCSSRWGGGSAAATYHGMWRIKDAVLVLTLTNIISTELPASVSHTFREKIIRVDDHRLVYETQKGEMITLHR